MNKQNKIGRLYMSIFNELLIRLSKLKCFNLSNSRIEIY